MRIIGATEVAEAPAYRPLIERLRQMFRGGFRPDMREAGDIVQPHAAGMLREHEIAADLFELTRGERTGRQSCTQITLFKSVGTVLEDLAAAQLAFDRV